MQSSSAIALVVYPEAIQKSISFSLFVKRDMAGAIMMLASIARWSAIFGVGSDDDEGMAASG